MDSVEEILQFFESNASQTAAEGMARFGIQTRKVYGISIPQLRKLAKKIGKNHELAAKLWEIDSRETRILAGMIDDPFLLTEEQMEKWVQEFDNWEVCDQVCMNLFARFRFAHQKALEWASRPEEFVKRAAFAIMAWRAFQDKTADNSVFEAYLPVIIQQATDERNFVKKAVNWALRQIGKRNKVLNQKAIAAAHEIEKYDSRAARWIARDALKELTSDAVQKRLEEKNAR